MRETKHTGEVTKVICLSGKECAKEKEVREARKYRGVYYTPSYIVDYIVKNTVGWAMEERSAERPGEVRVLDPACGDGAFLLGAYEYLLEWYLKWYMHHEPAEHKRAVRRTVSSSGDGWRLTIEEKKRILTTHIFGVDIAGKAVEAAKHNLLLKVLEGESDETLLLSLWQERTLPNLDQNIKCGNSLIGPDYFGGQLLPDAEELRRVNPFDWQAEFPQAMSAGGFDCVIGNPPYIRIQTMKEWAPLEVEAYKQLYTAASKGNYDIYAVFVECGLSLLNQGGRLGFILPHKFFNAQYGEPLRALVAQGKHLTHVVHFGDRQIFAGATTYTCLLFLDKAGSDECRFVKVDDLGAWRAAQIKTSEASRNLGGMEGRIPAARVTAAEWNFAVGAGAVLFERLRAMPVKLGDVAERIAQGIRTSANEVYVLNLVADKGKLIVAHSRQLDRDVEIEREAVSLFLQGREIKPYRIMPSDKIVILPYRIQRGRAELIPEVKMREQFPQAWEYLRKNKVYLESREKGRFRGKGWYVYGRQQNIDLMLLPKILVPDIADRASFALDKTGDYAFTSGYGITLKSSVIELPQYILGVLNSKVLAFYLKQVSTTLRGGFFRYFTQFIKQLPIRPIDFSNPADVALHVRMVALVERMLNLHKSLTAARTQADREFYQRQIAATDREIDALVYQLYGLTKDEIAIVEG